jgi:hypothetical protein
MNRTVDCAPPNSLAMARQLMPVLRLATIRSRRMMRFGRPSALPFRFAF